MQIRLAETKDLPGITAIYNEAIAARQTADTTPATETIRGAWLALHDPAKHPVFVAVDGDEVLGWCALSPYRPGRQALERTAEIGYYVASAHRRKGVATAMIRHCREAGAALGLKTLFAVVLEHNVPSRRILERMGFSSWGFFPGVADFGDYECGHYYYGAKLRPWPKVTACAKGTGDSQPS